MWGNILTCGDGDHQQAPDNNRASSALCNHLARLPAIEHIKTQTKYMSTHSRQKGEAACWTAGLKVVFTVRGNTRSAKNSLPGLSLHRQAVGAYSLKYSTRMYNPASTA